MSGAWSLLELARIRVRRVRCTLAIRANLSVLAPVLLGRSSSVLCEDSTSLSSLLSSPACVVTSISSASPSGKFVGRNWRPCRYTASQKTKRICNIHATSMQHPCNIHAPSMQHPYTYPYTCLNTCHTHVYAHVYAHVHTDVYTHVCTHVHPHITCMSTYTSIHTSTYTSINMPHHMPAPMTPWVCPCTCLHTCPYQVHWISKNVSPEPASRRRENLCDCLDGARIEQVLGHDEPHPKLLK